MEYLKSSIKSVLGTPNYEGQLSGAEIVEKLVDRILSSTLLDDRRDACRALKALSKTHRVDVGTRGMDALRQVIFVDETDCEIIGLALDTLCNITSPKIFNEEVDVHVSNHNVGEQFTEIFIKTHTSICQVLKFLEEFDFRVRWSALRLLTNLVVNKPRDIQEIVLISTMGVSKLMDVLSDSREIIRNDALLLLIHLTKGNTNIQKIVAFENAFDRIFDVILQEGNIEGGVVVEDCLLLMINLLRGNYSNQNFFKEGSFIQRLAPMLQLSTSCSKDTLLGWNDQKKSNMHCIIQVIRSLVAPCGPIQCITSCQKLMESCGLLRILCETLMVNGVPAEILSEVIKSIAEIIRGNKKNQDYLAQIMAPSSPTRSVIIVLLMSMVNEKQPFFLRCAVLYCFQCFLYKNAELQIKFLYTLLPQNNESSSLTTVIPLIRQMCMAAITAVSNVVLKVKWLNVLSVLIQNILSIFKNILYELTYFMLNIMLLRLVMLALAEKMATCGIVRSVMDASKASTDVPEKSFRARKTGEAALCQKGLSGPTIFRKTPQLHQDSSDLMEQYDQLLVTFVNITKYRKQRTLFTNIHAAYMVQIVNKIMVTKQDHGINMLRYPS
ncbi:general vesicular transport factor p115 [Copidosoma floridanum]|uniref:general vesicular transport factor p115 n=1 Tax=Copidosoma floridanum TaxID=29053 RepID=UPI0006C9670A|nr:general vesicular transport factor p115 [Copidosoma floridanum]